MESEMSEHDMLQAALEEWRQISARPDRWATFEAVRFDTETRCAVKWGVMFLGRKEQPVQTIVWTRYDDGRCKEVTLTHS